MSAAHQAPKGTFDVLPEDAAARSRVEHAFAACLAAAGYGRISTPIFEDTGLFARGVGSSTDIVRKEMFSFADQGGRELTLRPEGTASIARAFVEHGMHKRPAPVKLWYSGPFFRHEAPQAGRYRQFGQVGAEALGSDSPMVDAELIILLADALAASGCEGLRLRLSTLGSAQTRAEYRAELIAFLTEHESELGEKARQRYTDNPLRAFDSADPQTVAVMSQAPRLIDRIEGDDAEHFAAVRGHLDAAGLDYEIDSTLVRGLDYYGRTVFEFESDRLGAQSGVAGGGRYDGLVELLGGPPTPGVGWAAGIERVILAAELGPEPVSVEVYVVAGEGRRDEALGLAIELRRAGVSTDLDLSGRSRKGQMKSADRSGAATAVILEDDGAIEARDMQSGEQRSLERAALVAELSG